MAKETKAVETQAAPAAPVIAPEPTYSAEEIAQNSERLFGYGVDLATAALAYNRVTDCSLTTAKRLIKEFAERKV